MEQIQMPKEVKNELEEMRTKKTKTDNPEEDNKEFNALNNDY